MLLSVNGVARIATDLETRFTQAGKQITSFSVVSGDKYKLQDGTTKEDTCFVKVTAFGGLAKVISDYCHKGSKVFIIASLKQDKWENQQGNKKSMHTLKIEKLEMLDSKQDTQNNYQQPNQAPPSPPQAAPQQAPSNIPEIDITSEDIPF